MKTTTLCCLAIVSASLPATSQVLLNAGDTFTFEFTSIPLARIDPGGVPQNGFFQFSMNEFASGAGDVIRWELFENSMVETPFAVNTLPPGLVGFPRSELNFHWQDLQGVARLTMVSGSATLAGISIGEVGRFEGDDTSHSVYALNIVPVPEPPTIGLLAAAALGAMLRRVPSKVLRGRRLIPKEWH